MSLQISSGERFEEENELGVVRNTNTDDSEREACMLFTRFVKKNVGIWNFQDCVIMESIRCESVSANLDAMSESAIL